jgi:hypothetical protein
MFEKDRCAVRCAVELLKLHLSFWSKCFFLFCLFFPNYSTATADIHYVTHQEAEARFAVLIMEPTAGKACTGALISPRIVVTAAHCLTDMKREKIKVFQQLNLKEMMNNREKFRGVVRVEIHPFYTMVKAPEYDIALLKLDRKLKSSILKLPDFESVDRLFAAHKIAPTSELKNIFYLGYGNRLNSEGERKSDLRLKLTKATIFEIGERLVFNHNTCYGDSGGPIFFKNNDGERLLISVVSGADYVGTKRCVPAEKTAGPNLIRSYDWVWDTLASFRMPNMPPKRAGRPDCLQLREHRAAAGASDVLDIDVTSECANEIFCRLNVVYQEESTKRWRVDLREFTLTVAESERRSYYGVRKAFGTASLMVCRYRAL